MSPGCAFLQTNTLILSLTWSTRYCLALPPYASSRTFFLFPHPPAPTPPPFGTSYLLPTQTQPGRGGSMEGVHLPTPLAFAPWSSLHLVAYFPALKLCLDQNNACFGIIKINSQLRIWDAHSHWLLSTVVCINNCHSTFCWTRWQLMVPHGRSRGLDSRTHIGILVSILKHEISLLNGTWGSFKVKLYKNQGCKVVWRRDGSPASYCRWCSTQDQTYLSRNQAAIKYANDCNTQLGNLTLN